MKAACLFLSLLVAAPVFAAGPVKLAYVDLQKMLNETKDGKTARAKLEGEKKKMQSDIDKQQNELKKQAEEFEKQKVLLKDEARAKKQDELQQKFVALQQKFVGLQQDLSKREQDLTRDIFEKAAKEIEVVAKRDGYTMVLEKSESAVLYADPSIDITAEIVKRVDANAGKKATK